MSLINGFKTARERVVGKDSQKTAILVLLILLCVGTTYYSHFILRSEVVFSHLFYVPVALAGLWWGRRGIWVAVILAALLLTSHSLSGLGIPPLDCFLRSVMFVVVGLMVGILREQAVRWEKDLRETRDYLDSLIHYSNAPLIVWDPAFRITRFNHAFEHLTGYTAGEVIGQELHMLFPEASRDESLGKIARTLAGEYWESVEIPVFCRDGDVRLALWNSANIYAEDGTTLLATIAQGQEITERKQAEEALRQAYENGLRTQEAMLSLTEDLQNEIAERKRAEEERERLLAELEAKNRELESFVYTVSHDLKAPLVSLGGFSYALQEELHDQLGDESKHYLERIQANVAHMDALIMNLLELSRIGRVVGPIEEIDVATLVREIQEELALKLEEAGAEFVVQEPLPAVRADRGRFRQVFANLIDNAVKFRSEERPLRIEVGCQEERDLYRLQVADNGIGIAPRYHEEIFVPFRQLDPETAGVGIGLALGKKIVEHHGGRVWVESEEGAGATFYFTLPNPCEG